MAKLEKCVRCNSSLLNIERNSKKTTYLLECPKCGEIEVSEVEIIAARKKEN